MNREYELMNEVAELAASRIRWMISSYLALTMFLLTIALVWMEVI